MHNIYIYILVMAGVTYLIRMLPLALSRKEITSPFIKSFLYYVPYACLAAMTFPAILFATDSMISAAVGFVVALIAAFVFVMVAPSKTIWTSSESPASTLICTPSDCPEMT